MQGQIDGRALNSLGAARRAGSAAMAVRLEAQKGFRSRSEWIARVPLGPALLLQRGQALLGLGA